MRPLVRACSRPLVAAMARVLFGSACVAAPDLDAELARARVAQTTTVLAADGSVLAELHAEIDRRVIPLTQVPVSVRNAVVAIEDSRFYQHAGVDWTSIARAFARNASKGAVLEGGSTITQQLVKNTLVQPERSLRRKIREAVLATALEKRWTKDQILERYLNTVYFGRGAYGVEAAAKSFFGVHAKQLTLTQGALLAGMIASPSAYDPETNPKAAFGRRNFVLKRMVDETYITLAQDAA